MRFGAESAVPLIKKYPNLLVVQTMSKSHSLAGLRVGFAIGSEELIAGLNRVKNSFNSYPVDRIAQAGATASLQNKRTVDDRLNTVRAVREGVSVALRGIGFDVLPSKTNFIMIHYWNCPAKELFEYLRSQNILVRYFDLPRIDDYLRGNHRFQGRYAHLPGYGGRIYLKRGKSMRQASLIRKTNETEIELDLDIDGEGNGEIETGMGFFDHNASPFSQSTAVVI